MLRRKGNDVTPYTTVFMSGEGYYEEKKSRFLSYVYEVKTEQEAEACIGALKKQHYAARHHCFAYVLGTDGAVQKCSDDGEPQKTAGWPILSVIRGKELVNTLVVVVRYFGGTLLGTGGLVRAYTNAAADGIANAVLIRKYPAVLFEVACDYNASGKLQYFFASEDLKAISSDYGANVTFRVPVPEEKAGAFVAKITDMTQGKGKIEKKQDVWCGEANGRTLMFPD